MGVGLLFWSPLVSDSAKELFCSGISTHSRKIHQIAKFGKRPVYVSSVLLTFACSIWLAKAKTYGEAFAARFIVSFAFSK